MAKVSLVQRDLKRRRLWSKYQGKRSSLLSIANNKDASAEEKFAARLKLSKLPRNSSKSRIRNRCSLTGRPRGFYRKFGLSRIALRELASDGKLPGVVKSSWWGKMNINDPVGDMITRIRNAYLRGKDTVGSPSSN